MWRGPHLQGGMTQWRSWWRALMRKPGAPGPGWPLAGVRALRRPTGGARKDKGSSNRAGWASSRPWGAKAADARGAGSTVSPPPRTEPQSLRRDRGLSAQDARSSEQARAERLAALTPGKPQEARLPRKSGPSQATWNAA